ncbi:HAD family hydrolase [Tissierella praeacuta]|uniref:HAD family hydrolase n=1 Tax=Tissierella praeacuta TaxID=43131 RepID=UPI001C0FE106|nr:HAD family hydrolase [Tissierella praeacuta]MBU5257008.1 HAD family hydrolase [Tissierella praeacuta]
MYKLIAIDLDGTLLDDNKAIPQENLDIINQLIKRNYEIVIATGRRYWSAKELTKEIDGHMTILANNGNIVRNSDNDKVIFSKYLNMKDFRIIIKEGRRRNLSPIIHIDGYEDGIDMIVEFSGDYQDYLEKDNRFKKVNDCLEISDNRILAVVYGDCKEIIYPFYEDIKNKYPNIYNIHIMENIKFAETMLEIMNPLGSKWISLLEYASTLNIKAEEIIAIGDDNNDLEMIKNAGIGIAMKNSSSLVKSSAKIISDRDNNEAGVAFQLKRVLNI